MKPISDMNVEEKNREVAEWLGHEWNKDIPIVCSMMLEVDCVQCSVVSCPAKRPNPDFTTDAGKIQLLREMMKREDWDDFKDVTFRSWVANIPNSMREDNLDKTLEILDDNTGKLLNAVLEWKRTCQN